jgi:protease-3
MHGGSHNASTAPYRTAFYLEVENDALEGAVDRLADSIAAPLLDKKYADRERNAVNAELTWPARETVCAWRRSAPKPSTRRTRVRASPAVTWKPERQTEQPGA